MDDKFIYIPNDDEQDYHLSRLKIMVKVCRLLGWKYPIKILKNKSTSSCWANE